MRRLALILLLVGAAACGDDKQQTTDGGTDPDSMGSGSGSDGGVEDPTFTTYVIDMIENGTSDTATTKSFDEFSSLPDPDADSNNTTAYAPLFQ